MKLENIDNKVVKIGKSASENWEILTNSKSHHIFFHLSSFPSCFVILETSDDKEIISLSLLEKCALICKNNTKYKKMNNIKVDYTICENVKKENNVLTPFICLSRSRMTSL